MMANLSTLVAPYKKIPLVNYSSVLLNTTFPVNQAGSYIPSANIDDAVVADKNITAWVTSSTCNLDVDGYVTSPSALAWATLLATDNLPAIASGFMRRYRCWGKSSSGVGSDHGIFAEFNRTDGNNRWVVNFFYQPGSTRWLLNLNEVNAGVSTERIAALLFTTTQDPIQWEIVFTDAGDTIMLEGAVWETDTNSDFQTLGGVYYAANRFNKFVQKTQFRFHQTPYNTIFYRGLSIEDIKK